MPKVPSAARTRFIGWHASGHVMYQSGKILHRLFILVREEMNPKEQMNNPTSNDRLITPEQRQHVTLVQKRKLLPASEHCQAPFAKICGKTSHKLCFRASFAINSQTWYKKKNNDWYKVHSYCYFWSLFFLFFFAYK